MTTESREHLSSLMDGEINQETGRFLVRRLAADDALRGKWTRYHLIRDCLRHQEDSLVNTDLTGRVSAALADDNRAEPTVREQRSWLRPMIGSAVAASVALVAILTVSNGNQPGEFAAPQEMAADSTTVPFTSPNIGGLAPASNPVNLSGSIRPANQKINGYLLRHYQVAGENGKGFVSFVPIVVAQQKGQAGGQETADSSDSQRAQDSETQE